MPIANAVQNAVTNLRPLVNITAQSHASGINYDKRSPCRFSLDIRSLLGAAQRGKPDLEKLADILNKAIGAAGFATENAERFEDSAYVRVSREGRQTMLQVVCSHPTHLNQHWDAVSQYAVQYAAAEDRARSDRTHD